MRDAITGIGLVAFGTIAVHCVSASVHWPTRLLGSWDDRSRDLVAAMLTLAIAILGVLYGIARAPPQSPRQYYRRRRLWNFK